MPATTETLHRTRKPKRTRMRQAVERAPEQATAERLRRSLPKFIRYFWDEVSGDELKWNWHIDVFCNELSRVARRVAAGEPKEYDLVINVPPGTTKSITCSIMFPVWCWTNWPWMRFIAASYSGALSLECAEYSRDLVRSDKFRRLFPNLDIKQDKDTKSNFRLVQYVYDVNDKYVRTDLGGNRYSTSVGGTLTGFHGHILIVDDPLNPLQAASEVELASANFWVDQTLSTRKIEKKITPTILIMQRLHQNDPTGHWLDNPKKSIRHVCLPGEIRNYRDKVEPKELIENYVDDLLDLERMPWSVMEEMEQDLGQYGFAGQVGQNPVPPGGGMFKVDHFQTIPELPARVNFIRTVRYWDKAATADGGAYTAGVRMIKLKGDRFVITNVKRGRWATHEREQIIREVAEADGRETYVHMEQEGGSAGKDSMLASIKGLAGFAAYADRPTGDKVHRADPYSVQVNIGNIMLLEGDWVHDFIEEHRYFPFGTYKDQVDAASGAFTMLVGKREARMVSRRRR